MTKSDDSASLILNENRNQQSPLRVLIVDDHELLRTGTRRILEDAEGFEVVGEAGDGEIALKMVSDLVPDVALVDIRLPTMNGIELARNMVATRSTMTVLILSAYDDEDYVNAALSAGVSGYLLKTSPSHELLNAIVDASNGAIVIDKALTSRLGSNEESAIRRANTSPLTAREREVVRLAARGLANKSIGQTLNISPRTVEGHLNHVFEKLGTTSRTELVHFALINGLLANDNQDLGFRS